MLYQFDERNETALQTAGNLADIGVPELCVTNKRSSSRSPRQELYLMFGHSS